MVEYPVIASLSLSDITFILGGILTTLKYVGLSLSIGLCLASCLALLKTSKYPSLQKAARLYTSLFRGTPLLVQLSLIYFGAPQILNLQISAFFAGVLAFSLNSAAYLSEVLRAGIESLDRGQWEAAKVLQIPYLATLKDIMFPQVMKAILPSLANESTALLKDTALISILGEEDLMRRSQLVSAEKYTYFGPLLVAAAGYFVLILAVTYAFKRLEKTLEWSK